VTTSKLDAGSGMLQFTKIDADPEDEAAPILMISGYAGANPAGT